MDHIALYQLKLGLMSDSLNTLLEDLVSLHLFSLSRRLGITAFILVVYCLFSAFFAGNERAHSRADKPSTCREVSQSRRPHRVNAGISPV
jgi:hypothetical protein